MEKDDSLMHKAAMLVDALFLASRNPETVARIKHMLYRGVSKPHDILNKATDGEFGESYNYNRIPSYSTTILD